MIHILRPDITSCQLERVVQCHETNKAAAAALGVSTSSLNTLCRRYGQPTPAARHRYRSRNGLAEQIELF